MPTVVKCRVLFSAFAPPQRFSFDHWVPRPPNLLSQYQSTFRALADALGEKSAAHLDEVEWMRREWGTSGDGWEFKCAGSEGGYHILKFNAAWSAPIPVFLAMAQKEGPLRASWYEEYGQHAGHLLFRHDATEHRVVAAEVVKVHRAGRSGYRGIWRQVIGERFVPGAVDGIASHQSVDAYLTDLRDELFGKSSEVPLIRGDVDD